MKVKELAEILELSPATVSLVLNNRPGISEATRKKVKDAVIELGCEDMMNIKEKKKKTLLFVVYRKNATDDKFQRFSQLFSEIIEGVESQAKLKNFQLMLSYVNDLSLQEEIVRIQNINLDGILLLATEMRDSQLNAFFELGIPVVVLDKYMWEKPYDCVTINNELGVYEAISYLKEMGHKDIGYLHVVHNANNFLDRYFGFLTAVQKLEIPFQKKFLVELNTSGGEVLQMETFQAFQKMKEMPTAFFADNDILAIYAMQSLQRLGYRIPEDISIIGFDNMALSEILEPALTTIQVQKRKMGIAALNLLISKMEEEENEGESVKIEVSTSLIVRESVSQLKQE